MTETLILNQRYQLEDRLGSGGMAVVYRARDRMLERVVAVKVLRQEFSGDPAFRQRFEQEAKSAANLAHPNIVTVHDFGWDQGRLFIVMEYVPGTNLKIILQNRGRLSLEEALPLIIQACAGIGYAHRAGLVHCDVKPHNMLITPDQRLKVVDFGIARALSSIAADEQTNVVWGSPQYFSPEQAAGSAPSPASDVYSLGVILYEMLGGRLPFLAASAAELGRLHRLVEPHALRQVNPAVPAALDQIIMKVLSKEPSARYRTADQLGRVLTSFVPAAPVGVAPVSAPPSPASPPRLEPLRRPTPTYPPAGARPPTPHLAPAAASTADPLDIDWVTWLLGLLALIAVGGLVPFWLWVYLSFNP